MRKRFIAFLREHGAYRAYANALKRQRGETPIEFISQTRVEDWLYGAFGWADTRRGHGYWLNLHTLWTLIVIDTRDNEV